MCVRLTFLLRRNSFQGKSLLKDSPFCFNKQRFSSWFGVSSVSVSQEFFVFSEMIQLSSKGAWVQSQARGECKAPTGRPAKSLGQRPKTKSARVLQAPTARNLTRRGSLLLLFRFALSEL
jgi:hypothetical protein